MTNFVTTHDNVHYGLPFILDDLLKHGAKRESRNGTMRELLGTTIRLDRPWQRFHTIPNRNASPFAQLAETLWVMAGRNDIDWLSWYLPRAVDYSDDGRTWRAGYGPRLRLWQGRDKRLKTDQVRSVYLLLRDDPDTRRAVMSLWDPAVDYQSSKDIPCNDWIQFINRDGMLHMFVTVRSNDVMWGWSGINTFEWSFMQEVLATSLNLQIGPAVYFIGSLHLYEQHAARAHRIVADAAAERTWDRDDSPYPHSLATPPNLYISLDQLDGWLHGRFAYEEERVRYDPDALAELVLADDTSFRADALRMLDVYARASEVVIGWTKIVERAERITRADMRHAALDWLARVEAKRDDPTATASQPEHTHADVKHSALMREVKRLQAGKARTYGDSWKRYGEKGSIFPNIARKYDRLETIYADPGAAILGNETAADTLIDLSVYAALYFGWIEAGEDATQEPFATTAMRVLDMTTLETVTTSARLWERVREAFYFLAVALDMTKHTPERPLQYGSREAAAWELAVCAFELARRTFTHESWEAFKAMVATFDTEPATV